MTEFAASITKIENVLIRSGACAVIVLPQFGGKIASIRIGEQELLQQPLAPIEPWTRTMAFDAGDASGWDECLPSVGACTVKTEAGVAAIPVSAFYETPPDAKIVRLCFAKNDDTLNAAAERLCRL